jgi:nucleosome assembly protein 1-like 1
MPRRGQNNRRRVEEDDDDDDDDDDEEEEEVDEEIEDDDDDDDEEDEDDPLQHLPDYVIARVEKLQALHTVRESIMENYLIERAELEKKYEALLEPIYKDRSMIVEGIHDDVNESLPNIPTTDTPPPPPPPPPIENLTVTDGTTTSTTNTGEDEIIVDASLPTAAMVSDATTNEHKNDEQGEERLKGIPQFWACAMTRIEPIGELLTVDDLGCLDYLMDITSTTHEDGKGFTLTFHFSPNNPYFTNPTLTKSYIVPNLLISDEPIIKEVKGCTIYWKTGMSLTHKIVKKKQRGKGRNAGQVRSVTKQEEKESFFHWFATPDMPTSMDDMDEEEAEQLEETFENDYEIAQAFRCNIVPNAVLWFTGQVRIQVSAVVVVVFCLWWR